MWDAHTRACSDLFLLSVQVVKVLHGADRDVHWLQRDFGIYIANLFDTGQAARILHPRYGLAYLLQRYCNVEVLPCHPSGHVSHFFLNSVTSDALTDSMRLQGLLSKLQCNQVCGKAIPSSMAAYIWHRRQGCTHASVLHEVLAFCRQTSGISWQTGGLAHCPLRCSCMHGWIHITCCTSMTALRCASMYDFGIIHLIYNISNACMLTVRNQASL